MVAEGRGDSGEGAVDFQDCSQSNRQSEKKYDQNYTLFLTAQPPATGVWDGTVGLG